LTHSEDFLDFGDRQFFGLEDMHQPGASWVG
jgi:hypothetical protein